MKALKTLLKFIQMLLIITLWMPFIIIGAIWGVAQVGFLSGKELGEKYFEYMDARVKEIEPAKKSK